MDYFEKYGILPYINAHDTYTIYGGSRMSPGTLAAMSAISGQFVEVEQLQRALGAHLARITGNESAYITNGAAGGLMLAAAVCMAGDDLCRYTRLPDTTGCKNEIIIMRAQRNAYDAAVSGAGATIIEVGDADETPDYMLEGAITENTAAIFYFVSTLYERGSMPLLETIEIAHRHGIPVVVDAAAQLPPVENLWRFTNMGADLVLFSGGKTLCGPQDSGLIVGKSELIQRCIRFGAPVHGVCRASKTSRESMAGLCNAVEEYLALDHEANGQRLLGIVEQMGAAIEKTGLARCEMVPQGPVGQSYPRLFVYPKKGDVGEMAALLRAERIYIGCESAKNALYVSPLNLREEEAEIVTQALLKALTDTGKGDGPPHE